MSKLDLLIRFAAVAEELSFTKAALRLRVDQAWLSRQVQQLEAQLGFRLFVRNTRRVVLTPEGSSLLPTCRDLAAAVERTQDVIRRTSRRHKLVVAFGAHPYSYWLPARRRVIERFQEDCPGAVVEMTNATTPRLLPKLRDRTLDLLLIPSTADVTDLIVLPVHRASPTLVVPAEHPLAARATVAVEDVGGLRIAVLGARLDPGDLSGAYQPFFDAGAEPVFIPESARAVPHRAQIDRLAMISLRDVDEPAPDGFVRLPVEPPAAVVDFVMVRRREQQRKVVERFWKLATQTAGRDSADAG